MTEKLVLGKLEEEDATHIYTSKKEERPVVETGKEKESIREEISIVKEQKSYSICEICVCKQPFRENVAVFLCFVCEAYICAGCKSSHQLHDGMRVGSEESERVRSEESKRIGEECKIGRMREKNVGLRRVSEDSEKDEIRKKFLNEIMNESDREREDRFDCKNVCISNRVKVKHVLDKENCWITGLCGLDNTCWVVCDHNNNCVKIFKLGSNILQRYIQFESQPYGVTEVQRSAEQDFGSDSSSGVSVTNQAELGKQCLIAITVPWQHQITFIDLGKKPAITHKTITTEKQCYALQFSDAKLFILCLQSPYYISSFYVYIKSLDGETLYVLDTDIYFGSVPQLAVISGRVYITDNNNHMVHCRNVESNVWSQVTIKGSGPVGICVTPDNEVYVCANYHDKVYYLDSDLTLHNPVLDQTTGCIEKPYSMCYYQDKLYISHFDSSSVCNFVSVVRL